MFVIQLLCMAKMSDVVSAPVDMLALGAVREVLLCCNRWLVVAHQYLSCVFDKSVGAWWGLSGASKGPRAASFFV